MQTEAWFSARNAFPGSKFDINVMTAYFIVEIKLTHKYGQNFSFASVREWVRGLVLFVGADFITF